MRRMLVAGAFMLWPVFAVAQSNLYFPRLFTQQDRQSTGFAIVNPGPTNAAVNFTLYGADGALIAVANRTIFRGGQFAQLGSELFATTALPGWVQVTSATPGLQGFWLGGDFVNLTRGDGAVSSPLSTDQVFPYVPVGSELSIANPSPSAVSVTIKGYSANGVEVASNTRTIPPQGISQFQVSTIVQSGILEYLRINGAAPFVSAIVLRATTSLDNAVQNGIDVSAASPNQTTLIFPHFVDGMLQGLEYTSVIAVVNLSTSPLTLRFQFFSESGAPPVESEHFLSPQSVLRGIGSNFFTYTQFGFQNGYVRVTADGPIAGVVDYGTVGDGGEAIVPAQLVPQTSLLFAHIADLYPWSTGIAIQNPSNVGAIVEVYAMDPNGALIGGAANVPTAQFNLAAGAKTAKLLSELIPQTRTRASDAGFVFIRTTNGVPIHAIQLFFTHNLKILANISGGGLPPGVIFTPPNP